MGKGFAHKSLKDNRLWTTNAAVVEIFPKLVGNKRIYGLI
ncbi:hypothetical protein Pla110_42150 [Polystyrenella longa]|uniref:Uncharacterized protein n=1 Tax=Polystyrenella longa TaxID=2528007 RepID=A0A518CTA6_9PLAN|nr:hypothetical protein Pla110_42150 [Polystyrenella longa]